MVFSAGRAILGAWNNRQERKHLLDRIAGNTQATLELSQEETRALRVKNMAGSWSDEYILLWVTAMLTYGFLGCPFGGNPEDIKEMMRDPLLLAIVAGCYGFNKWMR